jgi:hypothetical protein
MLRWQIYCTDTVDRPVVAPEYRREERTAVRYKKPRADTSRGRVIVIITRSAAVSMLVK